MLKKLLMAALMKALTDAATSGKVGDFVNEILKDLANKTSLPMTMPKEEATSPLQNLLMNAFVEILTQLLATGKLNDLLVKLLQGLVGNKNLSLPLTMTECQDIELSEDGDSIHFHHSDGTTHTVSLVN